jgi:hypothetical protein
MLTQARLTFRLHRFTLVSITFLLLLTSAAAVILAARFHSLGLISSNGGLECDAPAGAPANYCDSQFSQWQWLDGNMSGPVLALLMVVAPLAGLLAGVGLVGREIEDRTASVAWSLAPSRTRWLVGRVAPVAILLAVLLAFAAVAGNVLQGARQPSIDPLLSFDDDGGRGPTLVALGLVAFALAVLFGSIIGRVLPALIAASMVFLVLIAFGLGARWALVSSQAVIVDQKHWSGNDGSIMLEQLVRYPSGEIGSANGMWWGYDDQGNLTGPLAGSTMLMREVPGSAYPLVAGVESGAMLVIAGGFLAASGLVVRRRRPY